MPPAGASGAQAETPPVEVAGSGNQPLMETPMDQPALFPLSELKTEGYAQPEPRDAEADVDDTEAEAA